MCHTHSILNEVSQKENDKYHIKLPYIYGIYKIKQTNLSVKQKQNHAHREPTCGRQAAGVAGEME